MKICELFSNQKSHVFSSVRNGYNACNWFKFIHNLINFRNWGNAKNYMKAHVHFPQLKQQVLSNQTARAFIFFNLLQTILPCYKDRTWELLFESYLTYSYMLCNLQRQHIVLRSKLITLIYDVCRWNNSNNNFFKQQEKHKHLFLHLFSVRSIHW